MLTVGELMTRKLITLKEDDDVVRGDDLLAEYDIRHLPVVKDGKLVGLVSHRDLIRALARQQRNPGAPPVQVRDIMTRSPETLRPTSSVREAIHKMLDRKFGCVPVVEDGDRLVGILTETDLMRLADRLLEQTARH